MLLACNTSHVFLDEVRALEPDAGRYIVDMIDLLACDAAARGVNGAFLLASEGTIASGIYEDRFGARGIEVEPADEVIQARLRDFIEAVKQNQVTAEVMADFAAFVCGLGKADVILGCTELPLLVGPGGIDGVALWDPMQAAIDLLVREVKKSKTCLP